MAQKVLNVAIVLALLMLVIETTQASITLTMEKRSVYPRGLLGYVKSRHYSSLFNGTVSMPGDFWPDEAYYTAITVGTPPQSLVALCDSGSSDLLVTTTNCEGCNKPTSSEFDMSASKSLQQILCNDPHVQCPQCQEGDCYFYNSYVTCDPYEPLRPCVITGPVITDVFGVNGTDLSATVYMGAITFMNITFPGPVTAIWGLAYQSGTQFGEPTVFDILVQENELANVFSMCFTATGGSLTLGGTDSRLHTGNIQYTPMRNMQGGYVVNINSVTVAGQSVALEGASIVDSGTMQFLVPQSAYQQMYKEFQALCDKYSLVGICDAPQGKSLFDGACYNMTEDDLAQFPDVTIALSGGIEINMSGEQYLYVQNPNPERCLGIVNSGPGGIVIIGNLFMQNNYVVFDRANNRMGWAEVSSSCGMI